jgi:hypothetical protein
MYQYRGGTLISTRGNVNMEAPELSVRTKKIADLEPFSEECEEHSEVDGARGLVHHRLQVLISRVLHIRSHC